jgi:ATP-dependent helicase HrpB
VTDFPITELLPRIRESLAQHPRLVLEAPPGAGKTTQVPLALLDAPWLQGHKILMLEPRRVAARAAAEFMARQLGQTVGETVGYRIRFDNKVSARTRIEVVTEGILARLLQDDPTLEGVGALLFDEFHERHLSGDLGLALALDVQASLREDLRIVLMSATLDGERLARWLEAPRLSSAGRSFPVDVSHFAARRDEAAEQQVRRAVEHALVTHPGDVLVFLPGQREIGRTLQLLERGAAADTAELLTLHGELPVEAQSHVLQPSPDGRRRVVLATNVAESSVTLPGVRVVIDSGLAREPRYDPNSGFSRLDAVAISQSSADQRAGRAGRVAAGWAYRLWPQSQRLEPQRRPEIAQVELAGLALELSAWGSDALRFVDPPPPGPLAAARELLQRLGALELSGEDAARNRRITSVGRRMLALGTHPRLAAMLLLARAEDRALACDVAALLEARDPLRLSPGLPRRDGLADRWRALASMRSGAMPADAHRASLVAIDRAAHQWRRRLRIDALPPREVPAHRIGDLLAHAYPDRIARQLPGEPRRYQLANGRTVTLLDDSTLYGEPWLVVCELRDAGRDGVVLRAAPVDEARLARDFPQRFSESDVVRWDAGRRALVSQRERRFDAILLDARPGGRIDPEQAGRALTDAVRELGLHVLPWHDALSQWRARVQSVRRWLPELADAFPDLGDEALLATLDDWLLPAFHGMTRLDALDETRLSSALHARLDWSLQQRLDALAPTRIAVPSGMARGIEYAIDANGDAQAPVLAVKVQELFGWADTPRIADGRIALVLHLLSPAGRPLQVTGDLRGFWERTWPEVRKEMKGRYPRHPWPEDPWNAVATHRAKPRGT